MGFLRFSWVDLLDIFLIAFIAYHLLRFIKGTRATQMLVGLLLILFLAIIANFWQMEGLQWIVRGFKTVWIVAFVIVFQPEIRRALTFLGRNRLIRFVLRVSHPETPQEVIRAIGMLQERGIGGLIVIERTTGLRPYIQTGTEIESRVSADLLTTLFTPPSPLHDGAVIIREDTIVAAGCILPLSDTPDLDSTLGTRHRAALGLAEESDAACIVISEETRKIAFATKGVIHRNLNLSDLDERLKEVMGI
jgi:diadenylate cyclase